MSLNKFTDSTTIKNFLNIGANSISCNEYKIDSNIPNQILISDAEGNMVLTPYTNTPSSGDYIQISGNLLISESNDGIGIVPYPDTFSSNGTALTKSGDSVLVNIAGDYEVTADITVQSVDLATIILFQIKVGNLPSVIASSVSYSIAESGMVQTYKSVSVHGILNNLVPGDLISIRLWDLDLGSANVFMNYRNLSVRQL